MGGVCESGWEQARGSRVERPHYHLERKWLRSSGLVLRGATISEKENQERKEEMEKGVPDREAGAVPRRRARWRGGVSGHSSGQPLPGQCQGPRLGVPGEGRGCGGCRLLLAGSGEANLAPASHREQAFQHLTNPRLGTDGSQGRGCHPKPEAETAWCSCLGADLICVQASGSSWAWVFPGAQPLLSTPGFQRGAHTPPLNTWPPLPGRIPSTRWPQLPASFWRAPARPLPL